MTQRQLSEHISELPNHKKKEISHLSPHAIAIKMLEEGHDDAFVMATTELSAVEIRQLKKHRD